MRAVVFAITAVAFVADIIRLSVLNFIHLSASMSIRHQNGKYAQSEIASWTKRMRFIAETIRRKEHFCQMTGDLVFSGTLTNSFSQVVGVSNEDTE